MIRVPLALLACAMAALVVAATHTPQGRCDGDGSPALGIVEVTGGDPWTTAYIDDRNFVLGNGVWFYIESNGIWTSHGLPGVYLGERVYPNDDVTAHNIQRGRHHGWPDDDEICADDPNLAPDLFF